ncbi:MAG TPA: alpha/beta hydrolase [Flavobacterium sp.]|nr:alpha/beta hydrolase [Flavobacterium sp.]
MRLSTYLLISVLLNLSCAGKKSDNDDFFTSEKGKTAYIKSYNQSLKLWDVPFTETDVRTSFGTAHVIVSGPAEGAPIVLLHGMDASSTMWFPNIKAFTKKHRTYAIDFPMEAGKSVASVKKMSKEESVVFYNEIFEHFKLKEINLVAASKGGWMATYLSIQPETRVKKLVLLSPAQVLGNLNSTSKVLPALMLKIRPNEKRLTKTFQSFSYYPEKIDLTFKKQFYLSNQYWKNKAAMLPLSPFSDKELQSLTMPVLILIGDHDIINDQKNLERARRFIRNSETETISNAGDFLTIDQADIVNKKVMDFLNKTNA